MGELALMNSQRQVSFLSRPEGKVGAVMTTGAVVACGLVLYTMLPPLIILLTNMIYACVLAGVLAGGAFVVTNKQLRMFISYLYRSFWRTITGAFVTIDPIGIMENYQEDLQKNIDQMSGQIGTLKGQENKLEMVIRKKTAEKERAIALAAEARRQGNHEVLTIQSNQMMRIDKSLVNFGDMRSKIQQLLIVLDKMYRYTRMVFEDLKLDIDNRKESRAIGEASYGAFTSAMKILKGDPNSRALYDQTIEYLDADYSEKMGQIRQFMDESGGMISSMDIENGVLQTSALGQIDEWESRTQKLLTGAQEKRGMLGSGYTPTQMFVDSGVREGVMVKQDSGFGDLFNK